MKMFKKAGIIIFMGVIVLSMTGCGKPANVNTDSYEDKKVEVASNENQEVSNEVSQRVAKGFEVQPPSGWQQTDDNSDPKKKVYLLNLPEAFGTGTVMMQYIPPTAFSETEEEMKEFFEKNVGSYYTLVSYDKLDFAGYRATRFIAEANMLKGSSVVVYYVDREDENDIYLILTIPKDKSGEIQASWEEALKTLELNWGE